VAPLAGIPQTTEYQIISKRNLWYMISIIVIIPGLIFFFLGGLKLGIDFTGGSMFELAFKSPPKISALRGELQKMDKETFSDVQLSELKDAAGTTITSIRSKAIDNKKQVSIFKELKSKYGEFEQIRVEVVGPTVGNELQSKAIWATLSVMVMIVAYLSFRFSFDYAMCAIICLFHDVITVLGFFSILGYFMGVEIDSLFVTAILTVAGFSVHDTIVTFDRIRENAGDMGRGKSFGEVANDSINQTLTRSMNTSLTTMFPLFCLTVFGGTTIKYFSLAMLMGIIVGTYSSIFVASPLLVTWREIANPSTHRKKAAA
jgi:preprotein translocase subunit SecF